MNKRLCIQLSVVALLLEVVEANVVVEADAST